MKPQFHLMSPHASRGNLLGTHGALGWMAWRELGSGGPGGGESILPPGILPPGSVYPARRAPSTACRRWAAGHRHVGGGVRHLAVHAPAGGLRPPAAAVARPARCLPRPEPPGQTPAVSVPVLNGWVGGCRAPLPCLNHVNSHKSRYHSTPSPRLLSP